MELDDIGSLGSYAKSRTITPAARRILLRSSGGQSIQMTSNAISVAAGEAGSGQSEVVMVVAVAAVAVAAAVAVVAAAVVDEDLVEK